MRPDQRHTLDLLRDANRMIETRPGDRTAAERKFLAEVERVIALLEDPPEHEHGDHDPDALLDCTFPNCACPPFAPGHQSRKCRFA